MKKRGQIFNQIEIKAPSGNWFDLSHDVKLSFNMGYIIPTCAIDVIPGDSFKIGFENLLRFAPLLAPVMHRVKATTHYFFVPNRILWPNWENWITGNLDTEPPFTYPFLNNTETPSRRQINEGSIADYMGIPPYDRSVSGSGDVADLPKYNALPFAAYSKIISDYYMDQNNVDPVYIDTWKAMAQCEDGDNTLLGFDVNADGICLSWLAGMGNPFPKAWEHDYFTSALPWAQKGDQVFMPIADFNDVLVQYDRGAQPSPMNTGGRWRLTDDNYAGASDIASLTNGASALASGGVPVYYDPNDSLLARTSQLEAGSASINNLRSAFRLQEWLEKNARGGTRYTESILSHFGVRSSDARLQRAEYLGGAVQNMVISEVLSTAQTLNSSNEVVNPVGQMSGHALSVGGSRVLSYRAEEHGWIIGVISVMPDTAYAQGIAPKFSKFDRLNYFWPSFAHLGEQEIKMKEVYYDETFTQEEAETTFGYIPRYAEYRFENSRIAGEFRSTLDFWHLGRKFGNPPQLNYEFIYPYSFLNWITNEFDSPFDRIFAVESSQADTIYAHILNKITARRLMPVFGTPSF